MAVERVTMVFALVAAASLISVASAVPGTATFYTSSLPSACYANIDKGTMIAAVNPLLFKYGAACGQTYTIRCTGPINPSAPSPCRNGPINVTIVDLCLACAPDQLELSKEAFSTIADLNVGSIRIDYNRA